MFLECCCFENSKVITLQSTRWDIFSRPFVNTVRPMLSDLCLSVTLVNCGQTVGWIKIKLSMDVGLGPGHIVSDGDASPPPAMGQSHKFSAHVCCGQMPEWINMSLGRKVGLVPRDIVLDEDPARAPQKWAQQRSPSRKRGTAAPTFGSRPSDHYFRSVCWFVCLSVCLSVCLFVCLCRVFLSRFDPIWIKLGHMLRFRVP